MADSSEQPQASTSQTSMWSMLQSGLDVLKKDLGEFSTTVNKDTTDAATVAIEQVKTNVSDTVETVQKKVSTTVDAIHDKVEGQEFQEAFLEIGQKIESNLGQILGKDSNVPTIAADGMVRSSDSSAGAAANCIESKVGVVSHFQDTRRIRHQHLQDDMATYLEDPADSDKFEVWCSDEPYQEDEAATVLEESPHVSKMFQQLVREGSLPAPQFWKRYFFKLAALLEDERKRDCLLAATGDGSEEEEEELGWDDDDASEDEVETDHGCDTDAGASSSATEAKDTNAAVEASPLSSNTDVIASKEDAGEGANDDDDWGEWD